MHASESTTAFREVVVSFWRQIFLRHVLQLQIEKAFLGYLNVLKCSQ